MMKRLSLCVRFFGISPLVALLFLSTAALTWAEAPKAERIELLSDNEATPCLLARASQVNEELAQSVKAAIEATMSTKCKLLDLAVDQPLSSNPELSWITPEGGVIWGLWFGRSIDGREFLVRGLDAATNLQFGMGKATTHNLTQDSAEETFTQLAENVLNEFPYLGAAQKRGFVSWSLSAAANSPSTCQLQFVKPSPVKRHPFIPVQWVGPKEAIVLGSGHCLQNRIFIDSKEVERALDAGERLWFKLANGR